MPQNKTDNQHSSNSTKRTVADLPFSWPLLGVSPLPKPSAFLLILYKTDEINKVLITRPL